MHLRHAAAASAAVFAAVAAFVAIAAPARADLVDPRAGGLEVVLGEWTVVAEAKAIRPGRVTLVVANRGRLAHGLRVRAENHHGGDDVRTRVLRAGERTAVVLDLAPGAYELKCFVEDGHGDHDDLGMRMLLVVRADAPLVAPAAPKASASRATVQVRGFAYRPATLRVKRGQAVRWVNADSAPHTVSAANGAFTSKQLGKGGTYARQFGRAGTFTYLCAVHPGMRAKVVVK